MADLIAPVFGPLALPECRRALSRGWVIIVRVVAALAPALAVIMTIWWWWIAEIAEPTGSPIWLLHGGLATVLGMLVLIPLVLCPALLAGSIAGDKQRGTLAMLLTSSVSDRDIVLGRLVGKLSQVLMIWLASLPPFVFLGALAGMKMHLLAVALVLPLAIALGASGIGIAASALVRRGRDALMGVYLLVILFLLLPALANLVPGKTLVQTVLWCFNPFGSIWNLVGRENPQSALFTSAIWVAMGLFGLLLAVRWLRPRYLVQIGGETQRQKRWRKAWFVPPVSEARPLLWKELFIERAGTLGWFGRIIGALILIWLLGTSSLFAGVFVWSSAIHVDVDWQDWALAGLRSFTGSGATFLSFFLQWAIALRAAVAIASERERATWDALLCSPLEGREIVMGKLAGSLFALRWLVFGAFWAWTVAAIFGAMDVFDYISLILCLLSVGTLMAAVGLRVSLGVPSTTRAMSLAMGIWLGFEGAVGALAPLCVLTAYVVYWGFLILIGKVDSWTTTVAPPINFETANLIGWLILTNFATMLVVLDTRLRFDHIAGRRPGTGTQIGIDRFFHGVPKGPKPGIEKPEPEPVLEGETR